MWENQESSKTEITSTPSLCAIHKVPTFTNLDDESLFSSETIKDYEESVSNEKDKHEGTVSTNSSSTSEFKDAVIYADPTANATEATLNVQSFLRTFSTDPQFEYEPLQTEKKAEGKLNYGIEEKSLIEIEPASPDHKFIVRDKQLFNLEIPKDNDECLVPKNKFTSPLSTSKYTQYECEHLNVSKGETVDEIQNSSQTLTEANAETLENSLRQNEFKFPLDREARNLSDIANDTLINLDMIESEHVKQPNLQVVTNEILPLPIGVTDIEHLYEKYLGEIEVKEELPSPGKSYSKIESMDQTSVEETKDDVNSFKPEKTDKTDFVSEDVPSSTEELNGLPYVNTNKIYLDSVVDDKIKIEDLQPMESTIKNNSVLEVNVSKTDIKSMDLQPIRSFDDNSNFYPHLAINNKTIIKSANLHLVHGQNVMEKITISEHKSSSNTDLQFTDLQTTISVPENINFLQTVEISETDVSCEEQQLLEKLDDDFDHFLHDRSSETDLKHKSEHSQYDFGNMNAPLDEKENINKYSSRHHVMANVVVLEKIQHKNNFDGISYLEEDTGRLKSVDNIVQEVNVSEMCKTRSKTTVLPCDSECIGKEKFLLRGQRSEIAIRAVEQGLMAEEIVECEVGLLPKHESRLAPLVQESSQQSSQRTVWTRIKSVFVCGKVAKEDNNRYDLKIVEKEETRDSEGNGSEEEESVIYVSMTPSDIRNWYKILHESGQVKSSWNEFKKTATSFPMMGFPVDRKKLSGSGEGKFRFK